MTGTSSSFARSFSARENSETSCWRDSTRLPEAADHIVLPLSHGLLPYHGMAHRQVRHFLSHGRFDAPR